MAYVTLINMQICIFLPLEYLSMGIYPGTDFNINAALIRMLEHNIMVLMLRGRYVKIFCC